MGNSTKSAYFLCVFSKEVVTCVWPIPCQLAAYITIINISANTNPQCFLPSTFYTSYASRWALLKFSRYSLSHASHPQSSLRKWTIFTLHIVYNTMNPFSTHCSLNEIKGCSLPSSHALSILVFCRILGGVLLKWSSSAQSRIVKCSPTTPPHHHPTIISYLCFVHIIVVLCLQC